MFYRQNDFICLILISQWCSRACCRKLRLVKLPFGLCLPIYLYKNDCYCFVGVSAYLSRTVNDSLPKRIYSFPRHDFIDRLHQLVLSKLSHWFELYTALHCVYAISTNARLSECFYESSSSSSSCSSSALSGVRCDCSLLLL